MRRVARAGVMWLLLLIAWPLFALSIWFMFHNPTAHNIVFNDDSRVGDRTCFAPLDITLFGGHNEYGGDEVRSWASERAQCDSAGHRLFAMGAATGVAGVAALVYGVVLYERSRRAAAAARTHGPGQGGDSTLD
jgi:hypothetical protein